MPERLDTQRLLIQLVMGTFLTIDLCLLVAFPAHYIRSASRTRRLALGVLRSRGKSSVDAGG